MATPVPQERSADEAAGAQLGVRALDDRTLEIELDHPAAYLPTVATTCLFDPIPQEVVEADRDKRRRDAGELGQ